MSEEAKINPQTRLQALVDSDIFLTTVAVAREDRHLGRSKNLGEYLERMLIQTPEIRSRLSLINSEKLKALDEKYKLIENTVQVPPNREDGKNTAR